MNEKLREALETIKDGLTWGQNSDVLIGFAEKALAASKQEPRHKKCPKCGEAVMFVMGTECCTKKGCDWMTTTSKQEPQAQAEPVKFGLWDSQWVNIVNDPALRDLDKEDAINLAVKNTERKCVENATKAIAKKDAAITQANEVLGRKEGE